MPDIKVPRLNNNDDSYILVEWLFDDGRDVPDGAVVAAVETAKAVEDIVVETGGVLRCDTKPGQECQPGDVIGRLFADGQDVPRPVPVHTTTEPEAFTVTGPAAALVREHGISDADLRGLGKAIVTKGDVQALVAGGTDHRRTEELGRNQAAVAATVTESHRTIPQAFAMLRIRATALVEQRKAARLATGQVFGALELLVAVLGDLADDHPLLYAAWRDDTSIYLAEDVHVGVTVDSGNGLTIPVLRSVTGRSLSDIEAELDSFRQRSTTGRFRGDELTGATISVSLANYNDMVASVPFVQPGQVAMLSLCGMQREWHPEAGRVPYFNLGLSYDHRVVNGRGAAQFLRAVKSVFEDRAAIQRISERREP
jgi:2-oxoglutarate dehydrogenase E2 component (dihydrolipoamide succinyltransferase)